MILKLLHNRTLLTLFVALLVVATLLIFSPVFHVLNKNLQNSYYSLRNNIFQDEVNSNIIIAKIDKKTLSSLGRFPFSRDVYIDFIKNVEKGGAATVGFDILFIDDTVSSIDQEFEAVISQSNIPIVFGAAITSDNTIELPHKRFRDDLFGIGYLPLNVNTSNGRVYSFSPFLNFDGELYEHFSLTVLRAFYSYLWDEDLRKDAYSFLGSQYYDFTPSTKIPLSAKFYNDILISFFPSESFRQISFIDLYDKKSIRNHDIQDSIILVGTTADGIKDEFFTPFGLEYGVYAHANILNTVLSQNYLIYFDKKLEWILLFLLIIISVYFNLGYGNRVLIISNIIIAILFVLIIPITIFLFTNLLMNYLVEIVFALILSLTISNGIKYLIEDKNKEKLKQSLSEYVGSNIAEEILEEGGKINFDGEEKQSILFFSDIEGFTTISEKLPPRKLVGFLREYLSQMSHIILDEKGYINKYEGDAIMAIWGVFTELDADDYMSVCRASLEQMRLLENLNTDWLEHYGHEIKIRIGIHSGDVIVGNIGAVGRKMEFTALGDTVNLASRLEGVNKFYGTSICVSDAVYKETCNHFEYRFLDSITVKGKKKPLKIYELLGEKGTLSEIEQTICLKFEIALKAYLSQDFQKAKLLFNELIDMGDKPSLTFKSRCSMYMLNSPGEDWDGVWKMEAK